MSNIVNKENLPYILDLYADTVLRIAYQNVKNITDAEDICQEVFLKLIEIERSFESEEHLKAFIIRITVNKCKDYFRSGWFRRRVSSKEAEIIENCKSSVSETEDSVLESVMELPLNYRNVIYLYYYEGYSVNEIAEILHKKEGTIKTWLYRARKQLKMIL